MKLNNRYIGCNHNIAYYGGIDSSFNGIFNKEEVLIEHDIGDIIPCMIGDVSEAYEIIKKKIKDNKATDLITISKLIFETVNTYFGGINHIDTRLDYYTPEDEIKDETEIGLVSNLKGKGAAMCVERAMLTQNLLKLLNIDSYYKSSGILKNNNNEVHSYNIISYQDKYYIFDTSIPTMINNEINPLICEIPKEVFTKITSPKNDIGYSVSVSHYNPLRDMFVDIIYDYNRKDIYQIENNETKTK